MVERTFGQMVERLESRVTQYLELCQALQNKNLVASERQARRANKYMVETSIHNLIQDIKSYLISGNLLEVTYKLQGRVFHATFTNISEKEFRKFVQLLNVHQPQVKMDILEIKEIPTQIKEIPL